MFRRSESPMAAVFTTSKGINAPPSTSGTSGPPPTEVGGSNPYRLGTKRPVINMTPAYDQPQLPVPPLSTPAQQPPPAGNIGYHGGLPPPPTSSQAPPTSYSAGPPVSTGGLGTQRPSLAPVQPHWFYLKNNEKYWFPFNVLDSSRLDEAFLRSQADPSYQVNY